MVDKTPRTSKDEFAARFQQMLVDCGMTRVQLAEQPGISQQSITNWHKRGRVGQQSAPLLREITGVSIEWLNEGIGAPLKSTGINESSPDYTSRRQTPTTRSANFFRSETPPGYVRFEHSRLVGPQGDQRMDIDFPEIVHLMEVRDQEAMALVGKRQNGAIKMAGIGSDAMMPTLNPRDVVFVDTEVTRFDGDGIYFFVYDGSLFCKRLQKIQRGNLAVISDNKSYDPWTIERDDPTPWRVLARVLSALPLQVKSLA